MQQVNLTILQKLLPEFWQARLPLYLWGRPSSGKTSIIRQFAQKKAKDLGLKYSEDDFGPDIFTLKVISLSQFDSPDLRGMPMIKDKGNFHVTQFVPSEELPRDGQGIIFFDEMNNADDGVRAACYQYVLEGRYGELQPLVGKDGKASYWRVAASNTEQDYSTVNQTSLALLRRFSHLLVVPELEEVIKYFLENNIDSRVIAYLNNYPQDLFPEKWNETLLDKKANPFPYTWEIVGRMIKGIPKSSDERLFYLAAASVGPEVAQRFKSFCSLTERVNIDSIIEKPAEELAKINDREDSASLYYSIISSLATKWFNKLKKLTGEKMVEIAKILPPEFCVAMLKMTVKKRTKEFLAVNGFEALLTKLGVFFDLTEDQTN